MDKAKEALESGLPATTAPDSKTGDQRELSSLLARKSISGADRERATALMKRNSQKSLAAGGAATGGVFLTIHEPHELDDADAHFFPAAHREAVLVVSVPRSSIARADFSAGLTSKLVPVAPADPANGSTRAPGEGMFVVPAALLRAMRPSRFPNVINPEPWFRGALLLPPRSIVRAYQIMAAAKRGAAEAEEVMDGSDGVAPTAALDLCEPLMDDAGAGAQGILEPRTISEYLQAMLQIRAACEKRGLVPLYHYTQPFLGPLIAKSGFRMSTQGQGDGGVYFSTLGPACYECGSPAYEDNIIVDCFGASRLEEYRSKHKLDLCIVYGAEPWSLAQAPGGRDNARVVSKATFAALSLPDVAGNYFLRPDRIMGMLLIRPAKPPKGYAICRAVLNSEQQRDHGVKGVLAEHIRKVDGVERSLGTSMALKSTISEHAKYKMNRVEQPQGSDAKRGGLTVGSQVALDRNSVDIEMVIVDPKKRALKDLLESLQLQQYHPALVNEMGVETVEDLVELSKNFDLLVMVGFTVDQAKDVSRAAQAALLQKSHREGAQKGPTAPPRVSHLSLNEAGAESEAATGASTEASADLGSSDSIGVTRPLANQVSYSRAELQQKFKFTDAELPLVLSLIAEGFGALEVKMAMRSAKGNVIEMRSMLGLPAPLGASI